MKMRQFSTLLAVVVATAAAVHLRSNRNGAGEQFFQFDYSHHGEDWMAGMCSSRQRQSPIDLPATAPNSGLFEYKYEVITAPFDFFNNGHSYSADFAGLGYGGITYNDAYYSLMNLNIHSLSEHSWGGVKKPLELHLVHKHYASEALLIVAVAFESATPLQNLVSALQVNTSATKDGKQAPKFMPYTSGYLAPATGDAEFNPTLQAFLKVEPPAVNQKVSVPLTVETPLDLSTLMYDQFYEYAGSLTAPPCAEIATWLVRKNALKASDKQVVYLHDAVYKTTADLGNYRALMPLNGREIYMRQATMENPPKNLVPAPSGELGGAPDKTNREFRAMKWAMDAMTIAKGATDYIKDLDVRLRKAAQAHAEALAPGLDRLDQEEPPKQPEIPASAQEVQMEETAKMMARTLAEATAQSVEEATEEMKKKAKEAALEAAMQAAGLVGSGQGNPQALANTVVAPVVGPPPPPLTR